MDRTRQWSRNPPSNESMNGIEHCTVVDPIGVRLKKRVFDRIFLCTHRNSQVHRWTVLIEFRVPQSRARFA